VPFVSFSPALVAGTMGTAWAKDGGALWETFFEGFCPNVSAWLALGCESVVRVKPKPISFYYPGIQSNFPWAIRQWYNAGSPKRSECDVSDTCDRFDERLFQQWRMQGHAVVRRAHSLNQPSQARVDALWQAINPHGAHPVLGIQMRGTDKRSMRREVPPQEFWPYALAFASRFPRGLVYVATESGAWAKLVRESWNSSAGGPLAGRVRMQPIETRVDGANANKGNFYVHDQLQVAHDVLLDIYTLAKSDYFLHGASAVAEAVIYVNPALHWRSTHLEYAHSCKSNATCHDAPWRWRRTYASPGYGYAEPA